MGEEGAWRWWRARVNRKPIIDKVKGEKAKSVNFLIETICKMLPNTVPKFPSQFYIFIAGNEEETNFQVSLLISVFGALSIQIHLVSALFSRDFFIELPVTRLF